MIKLLLFFLIIVIFSTISLGNNEATEYYKYYDTKDRISFTVPLGVFEINLLMEGGGNSNYHGHLTNAKVNVLPNEVYEIELGDVSTSCNGGYQASKLIRKRDNKCLLLLAGAGNVHMVVIFILLIMLPVKVI